MIQPANYPVVSKPSAAPVLPEVPAGPKARWVNEGGNNLPWTLLAVGTVTALAIAGIYFLK
jgi:hypothetical protein